MCEIIEDKIPKGKKNVICHISLCLDLRVNGAIVCLFTNIFWHKPEPPDRYSPIVVNSLLRLLNVVFPPSVKHELYERLSFYSESSKLPTEGLNFLSVMTLFSLNELSKIKLVKSWVISKCMPRPGAQAVTAVTRSAMECVVRTQFLWQFAVLSKVESIWNLKITFISLDLWQEA